MLHWVAKVSLSAKMGNDEGNSGTSVDAMIHDVPGTTRDVQQTLHSGYPVSMDALSHHIDLSMELYQLCLPPC